MTRPSSFIAKALISVGLIAGLAVPALASDNPAFNELQRRMANASALQQPAGSSPSWTFTNVLVPNATNTYVFGFGPKSSYVGSYFDGSNNEHGFVMQNGKMVQFDIPGALGTAVVAANATYNVIQGLYAHNVTKSFLVNAQGKSTTIAVPGATSTSAWAINAAGTIVVGSYVPKSNPSITEAFMFENGKYTTFAVKNARLTAYYGINAHGVLSGTYYETSGYYQATGFTINNGKMTTIQYQGVTATIVQGINDSGEVVGYVRDLNNASDTGFVYKDKTFTNVGVGVPDYVWGWAIDNAGDVAGFDVLQYEAVAGFIGKVTK